MFGLRRSRSLAVGRSRRADLEPAVFATVVLPVVAIGRLSMAMLMLRCPMTDRNFFTGIYVDNSRFKLMLDTERVAPPPSVPQA